METIMRRICTLVSVIIVSAASAFSQRIVVDHHSTDLSAIPTSWIEKAKATFRVGYTHTSHGSQIITGMETMNAGVGSTYYYSFSSSGPTPVAFMDDYWAGSMDLGSGGSVDWRNATINMLERASNDRNVVMWSWCGGMSVNSESDVTAYLTAMDSLERRYPSVTFIYMTGHLDGTGAAGNLNLRNEQVRLYCRTKNKILFDFADIESYDPDGLKNYMALNASDNCDYDTDNNGTLDRNWATDWVAAHPSSELGQQASACGECAHSQRLNCLLKARAFWTMMAQLAGWEVPVPIQLVSFGVLSVEGTRVSLEWKTLSETDNYGFVVERRRTGELGFVALPNAFVPGNGTSLEEHCYRFVDSTVKSGVYQYRLKQIDMDNTVHYSDPIQVNVVGDGQPAAFALFQNFPNPFNPSTHISYMLPADGYVELNIYDLLGKEVAAVFEGFRGAGSWDVEFDGRGLASGIYTYRLMMRPTDATSRMSHSSTKHMILLK
jgi:hypothetical protein